jgi:hypothetical protein
MVTHRVKWWVYVDGGRSSSQANSPSSVCPLSEVKEIEA